MRKKIIVIISILVISLAFLTACETKIKTGRYYLEGKNDVYIEILDGQRIRLDKADLSETQRRLDAYGIEVDVKWALSGRLPYRLGDKKKEIYVDIIEGVALVLDYVRAEKTIMIDGKAYKWRK